MSSNMSPSFAGYAWCMGNVSCLIFLWNPTYQNTIVTNEVFNLSQTPKFKIQLKNQILRKFVPFSSPIRMIRSKKSISTIMRIPNPICITQESKKILTDFWGNNFPCHNMHTNQTNLFNWYIHLKINQDKFFYL